MNVAGFYFFSFVVFYPLVVRRSSHLDRGTDAEKRAEEAILAADDCDGTIAGFTKLEWSVIQAPARYLGNEIGSMHKPWDSAEVRFNMAYPEIYEVGASNLGHVVLYTVLNNMEGLLCDRCYLPGDDMIELLKTKNRTLFAVESKRPLMHFDCIAMSLAYELGAVNIFEMLHLSGVPLTWADRDDKPGEPWSVEDGSWPLVFIGGPTATSNPEPIADFIDFVALGGGGGGASSTPGGLKAPGFQNFKLIEERIYFQLEP